MRGRDLIVQHVRSLVVMSALACLISVLLSMYLLQGNPALKVEPAQRRLPYKAMQRVDKLPVPSLHKGSDQKFGIVVIQSSELHDGDSHSGEKSEKNVKVSDHIERLAEEANINVRKAKELAQLGKRKLALKLFKHALALCPRSITALNEFGEFLLAEENIVQADLLFQRALSFDPHFSTALINRRRTAPIVADHDKNLFVDIDKKKAELYEYSSHHPTLRSAMKEFYYHHIYHTVALEGNTLTIEQIRAIIDFRSAVGGKSIVEHNEVIGMSEALQYMNNTLLMKIGEISISDIKNIHKRILGYVDPFHAGEFRTSQVFIGRHIPPHQDDLDIYMQEFQDWMNSPDVDELHPVEYAALAHYRLVWIHPFADGNGRTSRLLMNFILMKNGFPPVSVEVKDRWEYYETLTAANEGDIRPFVRFIARCASKTLDDYLFAAELPYLRMPDKNRHLFMAHESNGEGRIISEKSSIFNNSDDDVR